MGGNKPGSGLAASGSGGFLNPDSTKVAVVN